MHPGLILFYITKSCHFNGVCVRYFKIFYMDYTSFLELVISRVVSGCNTHIITTVKAKHVLIQDRWEI